MRTAILTALGDPPVAAPSLADPTRDIRAGAVIAALFFVLFLGWASFARLDAAAFASGSLVVSGQRQAVQHRDGGVVGAIYVREGQRVEKGQLLIRLAASEVVAQERTLASQSIRNLAQRARLQAEQLGQSTVAPPPEFASLRAQDEPEAAIAMRLQQAELNARVAVLQSQRGALGQRAAQSSAQGRGYGDQARSAKEQLRLIDEQIASLAPLEEKGFVSRSRMRDLQRQRAEIQGQSGQYSAAVLQAQSAERESEQQGAEAQRTFVERTASDLRQTETSLGELLPKWAAARDQMTRTEIRAPATGSVVGLTIFTPGGVIAPGQKLMDIVPERAPLLIQARIVPDDADDLVVGQRTLVKFSGLHDRALPNLEGTFTRLSADSFVDEKSGQSYFTGEVAVALDQLRLIQKVRGPHFVLHAGMPVQILIPLHKRTALEYALEPLFGSVWSSFREH
ncbi:HlyD family type I secretion periplasmic adaptor subunit [Sphingomonas sp. UYP23]